MKTLERLKPGDRVLRINLNREGGEMPLHVTNVTDEEVVCGPLRFAKTTGGEIDEERGWDGTLTGSLIKPDV